MAIVIAVVVLVVLAGVAIGRWIIANNYYVAEYSGKVSIVRGIQGSLLGISLHDPYLVACVSPRNELSLISYGQSGGHSDCELLTLQDLSPAGQAQVQSGLPGGTLDQAESQLRKLLADSLLACPPPRATSPPAPTPALEPTAPASATPPTTSPTHGPATTTPASASATSAPSATSTPEASSAPAPVPATTTQAVPASPHCRAVT